MKYSAVSAAVVAVLCMTLLQAHAEAADGIMMKDGKMMMITDGKATGPMNHNITMPDGHTVMTDGTMKMKDGTNMRMQEGQMMTLEGKMIAPGQAIQRRRHVIGAKGRRLNGMGSGGMSH